MESTVYDRAIKAYKEVLIMSNTNLSQYIYDKKSDLIDRYHQVTSEIQRTIFCKKLVEEKNIIIGELKALLDLSEHIKIKTNGL